MFHDVFHLFHLAQAKPLGLAPLSSKQRGNDLRNKTSRPQALTCWGPSGPLIPFPYWARPSVYQGFRYFPKVLPFSSSVEPSGINP